MIPLINGVNYASANISVIIPVLGVVTGITEINYMQETAIDDNYSLAQDPTSRGFGQNKYTADLSIYKDVWNRIIDISPLRNPTRLPLFDIVIVFGGTNVPFKKEVLRAVSFKSNPMAVKSGDTKLICKINLAIGGIDF
jgi:hypothetical protein